MNTLTEINTVLIEKRREESELFQHYQVVKAEIAALMARKKALMLKPVTNG